MVNDDDGMKSIVGTSIIIPTGHEKSFGDGGDW
jgi:hypothetical protein